MILGPSSTIRSMPRSGIREINDLASQYTGVIHLEIGQPNFSTPEHISRAAGEAALNGFTTYTPNAGIPELREAIAEKLRKFNGIDAAPENVTVTTGGCGALFTTLVTLCDPGDAILLSDPTWPNYEMMASLQGLEVRHYPLRAEDGWLPNPEEIEKQITLELSGDDSGVTLQSHRDHDRRRPDERTAGSGPATQPVGDLR